MERVAAQKKARREPANVRLSPPSSHRATYVLRALTREMNSAAMLLTPGSVVLDYGCGSRPYESLFLARGSRYLGADLAGSAAVDVTLTNGEAIPLPTASVDAVLSSQVLEHVEDPAHYLAEAARILKPSGFLILSTHGIWRYHPDPQDLWRWTSAGLRRLIGQAGFRIDRFRGIVGLPAAATQLWQDALYSRLPRPARPVFATLMQLAIAVQDRLVPSAWRDQDAAVYSLVARKHGRPASSS